MASSLSNLVEHLDEEIHKVKCIYGHDNKKWETCGVKYKYCERCVEYKNIKDKLVLCKCLCAIVITKRN